MQNRVPEPRETRLLDLAFEVLPRRHARHDGWTAERQRAFIEALAATGSVSRAARSINMSPEGAYNLRRAPGAESFRAAWSRALDFGVQRLVDVTMERAIDGVAVPVFWKGEQVGEKRVYNDRLAMFHMRHRLPDRYGPLNPPGRGTRHPENEAREAAEAAGLDEAKTAALAVEMFELYARKVTEERVFRLAGRVVEADFTLRQLTQLELMIELGGAAQTLIDFWFDSPWRHGGGDPGHAGAVSELLDHARRQGWEAAGDPPRPPLDLRPHPPTVHVAGGPTLAERQAAQRDAQSRIAAAQREWEAAATEEGWAEWQAAAMG